MNRIFEATERYMAAVAFAEAGEFETALEMAKPQRRIQPRKRVQPRQKAPRPRPEMRAPSMDE